MLESFKFFFVEGFGLFSPLDWLVFGGCFIVFVLVYFLACLLRNVRFFIPQFLKLIAFCIFIISPIATYYINQEILYKNEVHYKFLKRLEYSPTFFVDAEIQNLGTRTIGKCYFVVHVLREEKNFKNKILNCMRPITTLKYEIDGPILSGERKSFNHTFNRFNYPLYQTQLYCYGGKNK